MNDGFSKVVSKSKRGRKYRRKQFNPDGDLLPGESAGPVGQFPRLVESWLSSPDLLAGVGFCGQVVMQSYRQACQLHANLTLSLVAYGIGRFSVSRVSQIQLAALVLLRQLLANDSNAGIVTDCSAFDPVWSQAEVEYLENRFKIKVLLENNNIRANAKSGRICEDGQNCDDGRICVNGKIFDDGRNCAKTSGGGEDNFSDDSPPPAFIVYYMPHCGRPLYNSVLYSHWSPGGLAGIALVGNSLQSVADNLSRKPLRDSLQVLCRAAQCSHIQPFPALADDPEAFNDTCVHTFPPGSLPPLVSSFWLVDEPEYCQELMEEVILT